MHRTRLISWLFATALGAVSSASWAHEPQGHGQRPHHHEDADGSPRQATGVVFHDRNGNRTRDEGEEGLGGIRVSNGLQIVKTDAEGRYRLPVGDDTIVFVIKPRNWMTPVDEDKLPQFYYIHKPWARPRRSTPASSRLGHCPRQSTSRSTRNGSPTDFAPCSSATPSRAT